MSKQPGPSKNQFGVVLIISLVMLLLLTLIGLTGMQTTSLEEKMAGNAKDRNTAFQAAEATLLEAENYLLDHTFNDSQSGLFDHSSTTPPFSVSYFFTSSAWEEDNYASTPDGFGDNFGLPSDPRYVIEKTGSIAANGSNPAKTVFRITSRAVGQKPGTQVILQVHYTKS